MKQFSPAKKPFFKGGEDGRKILTANIAVGDPTMEFDHVHAFQPDLPGILHCPPGRDGKASSRRLISPNEGDFTCANCS
jgi:hypothetical protein